MTDPLPQQPPLPPPDWNAGGMQDTPNGYQSAPAAAVDSVGPNGAPFASFGSRVGGSLIDGIFSLLVFVPGAIFFLIDNAITAIIGGILMLAGFVLATYLIYWLPGETKQTPGKRMMGTEMVDSTTGAPIGGGRMVLRQLIGGWANSVACYLGWLWPLFDKKNQTFADKIASSVVVEGNKGGLFPLFPNGKPF